MKFFGNVTQNKKKIIDNKLQAKIKSVDSRGNLKIQFSKPLM